MINLNNIESLHTVWGGQAEWCDKWKCLHAHVFIHPGSLGLLVGTFNPFTFKVIINMYNFGFISVGLSLVLSLLPTEGPLTFVIKVVWWCWILSAFGCLESYWFLHQIWMRVLLGRVFLVVGSSLSSLQIYPAIPFWLVEFLLRNQLIAWWEFLCVSFVIFPVLLSLFYP